MEKLKFIILATAAIIATAISDCNAQPQSPQSAADIIERMSAKIKSMGSYEALFSVETGSGPIKGYYAVNGDMYYIRVEEAEVFCDGSKRYEVNPENREIMIDLVGDQSDLLSNPTRAFDFLNSDFSISYAASSQTQLPQTAGIKLVPTGKDFPFGTIYLDVDTLTGLPEAISYDADGDRIDIQIDSIRKVETPDSSKFTFDAARYPDYAIIDFTE